MELRYGGPAYGKDLARSPSLSERRFPPVDLESVNGRLVVKAEMPGIRIDDLNIRVFDGQLMIRGKKREEDGTKKHHRLHEERMFGFFSRVISLGQKVDPEKVKLDYKDGILTITLEKSKAKPIIGGMTNQDDVPWP